MMASIGWSIPVTACNVARGSEQPRPEKPVPE
jgi:hypothetical protein